MKIHGKPYRTIWTRPDETVEVIDQTRLPHRFETVVLKTAEDCAEAIRSMVVRGAPLIGATAAYGVAFAMKQDPSSKALIAALDLLGSTRPTAVNLKWALKRMHDALHGLTPVVVPVDEASMNVGISMGAGTVNVAIRVGTEVITNCAASVASIVDVNPGVKVAGGSTMGTSPGEIVTYGA